MGGTLDEGTMNFSLLAGRVWLGGGAPPLPSVSVHGKASRLTDEVGAGPGRGRRARGSRGSERGALKDTPLAFPPGPAGGLGCGHVAVLGSPWREVVREPRHRDAGRARRVRQESGRSWTPGPSLSDEAIAVATSPCAQSSALAPPVGHVVETPRPSF